jgi:hypothetical protein
LNGSGGERLLDPSSKDLSLDLYARMSEWDGGGALGFLLRYMVRVEELSCEAGTVPSCRPSSGRGVEEGELTCPVDTAGAGEGRTGCMVGGSVGRSPLAAVADRPSASPVPNTLPPAIPSFTSAATPTARARS